MVKLCLMASHGYLPGNGLVFVQEQNRVFKDLPAFFPSQGAKHAIQRTSSLSVDQHKLEEAWKPMNAFNDPTHLVKVESPVRDDRPVLIDVQDACPDSILFSYGIAEKCTKHEKILKFLTSGSSELEKGGLDLSILSDMMDLQALTLDLHQQPWAPLIYPNGKFDGPKPLVDFVGEMAHSSRITFLPDGRVMFTGSGTEMKDMLSIVAEFYLAQSLTRQTKQSMLVPHFSWPEVQANVLTSSLNIKDVTAPLKSPERTKLKPSTKKKSKRKGSKERDLYQRNYFHACESLLSLMMDKNRNRKTAILSLKKSGPELPSLLTQFSAGIAGTGLAVLFSVVCTVACGRVPFCATKLFCTGFGFGLVWLAWSVNRLRDTIVYISRSANKLNMKDEDMLTSVDKSMKDVYFRAATVMVVAALRFA